MRYAKTLYYQTRIIGDMVILVFSFLFTYYLFNDSDFTRFENYFNYDILILLLAILFWYIVSQNVGLYNETRTRKVIYEIVLTIKALLYLILFIITLSFISNSVIINRSFVFYFTIFSVVLIIPFKFVLKYILSFIRLKGRNLRSLLIIGAGPVGEKFFNVINNNPQYGYRFVGFLDDNQKLNFNGQYLGKINELEKVLETKNVDDVIIALPNYAYEKIERIIRICENYTTRVRLIPDIFRFTSGKFYIDIFNDFPIVYTKNEKINEFHWRLLKRGFDVFFSLFVIVFIFSWLFPIIAFLIKIDSKGPVFFTQDRWGRNNKKFKAIKFRSMVAESKDTDEKGNYLQATKNDPRVTRVGKILRKTNIDELPQFFNVLMGDMSVVGPRPHPIPLNLESKKSVPKYMQRTLVKPGITGWAQVNGLRGETKDDPEKMKKRVEYDLWYIDNWSFWLDIQIIFMTIWQMFKGDPNAY